MIAEITLQKPLKLDDLKLLVNRAGEYNSNIFLTKENCQVNVKSILGLACVLFNADGTVHLDVQGIDEKEAMETMILLLN